MTRKRKRGIYGVLQQYTIRETDAKRFSRKQNTNHADGIKKSECPDLYFRGGVQLANKIFAILQNNGIQTECFLINKQYWKGEKELYGMPVYILEEYLEDHDCVVIIGFAGYKEHMLDYYKEHIKKLYVLDFIGQCVLGRGTLTGYISKEFCVEYERELAWLMNCLADKKSKTALQDFIYQRASGQYSKEYDGDQYFPADIIQLEENETFVDCGAYLGESALEFIERLKAADISSYERIISIEAEADNAHRMKENLKAYHNIEIIEAGVWNQSGILHMNTGLKDNSQICDEGDQQIEVRSIDDILHGEKATYIKMDIEGSELKALEGASHTIKRYKPKLAICIYHKPEDLVEIPVYIYALRPDYRFYIRNHSPYGIETVLYAV